MLSNLHQHSEFRSLPSPLLHSRDKWLLQQYDSVAEIQDFSIARPARFVSTKASAIALTVIPCFAHFSPSVRTSWSILQLLSHSKQPDRGYPRSSSSLLWTLDAARLVSLNCEAGSIR